MPLTVDNTPELTAEVSDPMAQQQQKCKVLRAFYKGNKVVGAGSVLALPKNYALELRGAGKVEFVADDAKENINENPTPKTDANPEAGDGKKKADAK